MLSYQHRYHAGNFADVHKHLALCAILQALAAKPAPFCVIDTHAGEGRYRLDSAESARMGEWRQGVAAVRGLADPPPPAAAWLAALAAENPDGALTAYPGSPALALALMRPQDRLVVNELHPAAHAALRAALGRDDRVHPHRRDAAEALRALLPPAEKRGLVLLDPSFEVKAEYETLPAALLKARQRWATGIFMLWYPLLEAGRHQGLVRTLAEAGALIDEWRPRRPASALQGSGVAILNAPWKLDQALADNRGWARGALGLG